MNKRKKEKKYTDLWDRLASLFMVIIPVLCVGLFASMILVIKNSSDIVERNYIENKEENTTIINSIDTNILSEENGEITDGLNDIVLIDPQLAFEKDGHFYVREYENYASWCTDNTGTEYERTLRATQSGRVNTLSFLNEGYMNSDYFICTAFVSKKFRDYSYVGSLRIYGDGILLYDTGEMGAGSFPQEICLSISDYEVVTFEMDCVINTYDETSVEIGDGYFGRGEIPEGFTNMSMALGNEQRIERERVEIDNCFEKKGRFYMAYKQTQRFWCVDLYGGSFDEVILATNDDVINRITFLNDGKYDYFQGTAFVPEDFTDCEYVGSLRIYGDEILIYDSGVIGGKSGSEDINIDISEYEKIIIEMECNDFGPTDVACYALGDPYFISVKE